MFVTTNDKINEFDRASEILDEYTVPAELAKIRVKLHDRIAWLIDQHDKTLKTTIEGLQQTIKNQNDELVKRDRALDEMERALKEFGANVRTIPAQLVECAQKVDDAPKCQNTLMLNPPCHNPAVYKLNGDYICEKCANIGPPLKLTFIAATPDGQGERASGPQPKSGNVLEQLAEKCIGKPVTNEIDGPVIGKVFDARVVDKKVEMRAYIDLDKIGPELKKLVQPSFGSSSVAFDIGTLDDPVVLGRQLVNDAKFTLSGHVGPWMLREPISQVVETKVQGYFVPPEAKDGCEHETFVFRKDGIPRCDRCGSECAFVPGDAPPFNYPIAETKIRIKNDKRKDVEF